MSSKHKQGGLYSLAVFLLFFGLVQVLRQDQAQKLLAATTSKTVQQLQIEICGANSTGVNITAAQRKEASDFINQVNIINPDFGINDAVNKKQLDGTKFLNGLLQTSAVWVVFMIFSFFGYFAYCSSACCPDSCPCCKACRRNVDSEPYSSCEIKTPPIFSIIFSLMIIASGAIGLVYAPQTANGMTSMRCQFMTSLLNIVDPIQPTNAYPGIEGLIERLTNINSKVKTFSSQVDSTFGNSKTTAMKNTQKSTLNYIEQNYTTYKTFSQYTTNANGDATATDSYYGTSQQLYDYIMSSSAPTSQASTDFTPNSPINIYNLLNNFYSGQISVMNNLEQSVNPFKTKLNFGAKLKTGISQGNLVIENVNNMSNSLADFTSPLGAYSEQVTLALIGLYAASLGLASLSLLGMMILLCSKKYGARKLIHIAWFFYSLIMILGFLLGSVLNPASVLSLQFCGYLDKFIHDKSFFLTTRLIEPGQTFDLLEECFFGKGDILSILNITQATSQLSTLVTEVSNFQTNSKKVLSKAGSVSTQVNQQTYIVGGISNCSYFDYDPADTAGVQSIVDSFNSFTTTGCKEIARFKCKAGGKPSYTDTTASCWHPSLLYNSSTNYQQACADQQSDGLKLTNWFTAEHQKWSGPATSVTDVAAEHVNTQASFNDYVDSVDSFISDSDSFVKYNTNPKTGLIHTMNCSLVQSYFSSVYDSTCVLFVPAVYRSTILIIAISVAMFFGSCANVCAGVRYYRLSKLPNTTVYPVDQEESQPIHGKGENLVIS